MNRIGNSTPVKTLYIWRIREKDCTKLRKLSFSEEKASFLIKVLALVIGVCLCTLIKCSCGGEEDIPSARYGFITFTTQWDHLLPGHTTPKTLRYCFYPSGKGAMIQTEGDASYLKFALPPDTYRVLIFNCDAENIQFGSMQTYESAEALFVSSNEQKVSHIDPLYVAVIPSLVITAGQAASQAINPESFVRQLSFRIHIEGGSAIRHCSASLSGIIPAVRIHNRNAHLSSEHTLPFTLEKNKGDYTGQLLLLDAVNNSTTDHSLMFTLNCLTSNNHIVTSTVNLAPILSTCHQTQIEIAVDASILQTTAPSITFHNWKVTP